MIRALAILLLFATPAHAELKTAHAIYLATASADAASTAYALSRGARELNPVINWAGNQPGRVLVIGAVTETVALGLAHQWIGRRHPTAFRRALYVVSAARVGIVAWNLRQARR